MSRWWHTNQPLFHVSSLVPGSAARDLQTAGVSTFPIGKDRPPTTIFEGRTVKLRWCIPSIPIIMRTNKSFLPCLKYLGKGCGASKECEIHQNTMKYDGVPKLHIFIPLDRTSTSLIPCLVRRVTLLIPGTLVGHLEGL